MPSYKILSEYLKAEDAAKFLGVSPSRFHRIVKGRDLIRLETPHGALYAVVELERVRTQLGGGGK